MSTREEHWTEDAERDGERDFILTERRCLLNHCGQGPQCCLERNHEGRHMFKCAGNLCPGLSYPASEIPHPVSCDQPTNSFASYEKRFNDAADSIAEE